MPTASAECTEILGCLWHIICIEPNDNTASRLIPRSDVKEHLHCT